MRSLRFESLEHRRVLSASPWQNPVNVMDINSDSFVSPIDALLPINELNQGFSGTLQESMAPPMLHDMMEDSASFFMDTNGDGYLSPNDVLGVINLLSNFPPENEMEEPASGEQSDLFPDVPGSDAALLDMDWGYAFIDSELNNAYDADAFQFVAEDDRVAIDLFNIDVPDGLVVELLNANLETIASSTSFNPDAWGDSNIDVPVEPAATYYVVVSGSTPTDTGEYVLDVYQYQNDWWEPVTDSERGDDVHGNTTLTATLLDLEYGYDTVTTYIDSLGDLDVFEITVEQGQLDFSAYPLGLESLLKISVTDSNNQLVGLVQGNHEGAYGGITVSAGTYHITVESINDIPDQYMLDLSHWGNYEWEPMADSTFGNDIHADEIGIDATELQIEDGYTQRISHVDTLTDKDVFRITAEDDFLSTTVYASDWTTVAFPDVRLFDAAGNEQYQVLFSDFDDWFEPEDELNVTIRDIEFTEDDFQDPLVAICYWPGGMYPVTAGEPYYVVVDAGIENFVGQYTLEITHFSPEPWEYIDHLPDPS
ncbi:MAG: dockerin type I domain-containing protein [Planctomycetota bacterium]|nr:dockerin type I domain-containing protein [Planctomycetota bacterium]